MALNLYPTDDHIVLEEIIEPTAIHLLARDGNEKKKAKVVAVGPGVQTAQGIRLQQPCKVGDTVLVSGGAGFRVKHEGAEYWFVYGNRSDIIAVISA